MHHLIFVTICLIWGSNFILMNRAGLALGAAEIGFWRLLGGGGTMALIWLWSKHGPIPRKFWPHIFLVSFFGNAYPFVLQPVLINMGFGHSYFGITLSFVPLLTVIFSIPMLSIWPSRRELVGVLGGLVALVVLLWDGSERGMSPVVLALAFSVPLVYAACNTYIRLKLRAVPPIPLAAALFLTGAAIVLPILGLPGLQYQLGIAAPPEPRHWSVAVTCLAWLAIIGTGFTGFLFFKLIHARGPLFAGMVSYLIPLVAIMWGAYDNEAITVWQLSAVLVVLAMVALVQTEKSRQSAVGSRT